MNANVVKNVVKGAGDAVVKNSTVMGIKLRDVICFGVGATFAGTVLLAKDKVVAFAKKAQDRAKSGLKKNEKAEEK